MLPPHKYGIAAAGCQFPDYAQGVSVDIKSHAGPIRYIDSLIRDHRRGENGIRQGNRASQSRVAPRKSSPGIREDNLKLELRQAVMQCVQSRHSRLSGIWGNMGRK